LASTTVSAESASFADAATTAVMVLGSDAGLQLLESLADSEGYLVTKYFEVVRSSGFFKGG